MRRTAIAVLMSLGLACGGGERVTPAAGSPSTRAVAEPGTFRIATFNIQHGINNDGRYGLKYAIQTIAALNPDIIGVQELTRNHPAYKCEDQPLLIAEGLEAATGRTWSYIYKNEWTTKVTDCGGDTPETEGIGFFAPAPTADAGSIALWNGRLGVKTILQAGRPLPVMVTHLQSGKLDRNASDRVRQLATLLPWTNAQGTPRVLVCDCNLNPASPEYQQIRAGYRDAWADAVAAGTAKGRMDGITHKSSRIDYVFYDPGTALELVSVENVETPALIGLEASDHRPVMAVFRFK
jgi:endonuclease/exonuclease/phosphatase family metal-dependent hydrolase